MKNKRVVVCEANNKTQLLYLSHVQFGPGSDATLEQIVDDLEAKYLALAKQNDDLVIENKDLKTNQQKLVDLVKDLTTQLAALYAMEKSDISSLSTRIANMEEK